MHKIIVFLLIFNFLSINDTFSQTSKPKNELDKIVKIFFDDVKFTHLLDSSNNFYVFILLFTIDPKTNRPIIYRTGEFPKGSYESMNDKLLKFEALDINWSNVISDFSFKDSVILPTFLVKKDFQNDKKPKFTLEGALKIIQEALPNIQIREDMKIMDPIYYYINTD